MIAGRQYTPRVDAPLSAYLAMLDANGSSHGVLIQPSFLGADNSYLLRALDQHPARLRGIVVVAPETGRMELQALRSRGVAGVRLNLAGEPDPDLTSRVWRRHLTNLASLDLQVEIHAEAGRLPRLLPPLLAAGVRVVVDHFGRPDAALGVQDPGFRYLLSLGRTRQVWVKLSGAYRLAQEPHGDRVALEAAPLLLDSFGPGRLVWGSDWPHTRFEAVADTHQTRLALDSWVPDPAQRNPVLSSTPAELFGLDASSLAKS